MFAPKLGVPLSSANVETVRGVLVGEVPTKPIAVTVNVCDVLAARPVINVLVIAPETVIVLLPSCVIL